MVKAILRLMDGDRHLGPKWRRDRHRACSSKRSKEVATRRRNDSMRPVRKSKSSPSSFLIGHQLHESHVCSRRYGNPDARDCHAVDGLTGYTCFSWLGKALSLLIGEQPPA